jgi:hypothetical protein
MESHSAGPDALREMIPFATAIGIELLETAPLYPPG